MVSTFFQIYSENIVISPPKRKHDGSWFFLRSAGLETGRGKKLGESQQAGAGVYSPAWCCCLWVCSACSERAHIVYPFSPAVAVEWVFLCECHVPSCLWSERVKGGQIWRPTERNCLLCKKRTQFSNTSGWHGQLVGWRENAKDQLSMRREAEGRENGVLTLIKTGNDTIKGIQIHWHKHTKRQETRKKHKNKI